MLSIEYLEVIFALFTCLSANNHVSMYTTNTYTVLGNIDIPISYIGNTTKHSGSCSKPLTVCYYSIIKACYYSKGCMSISEKNS